MSGTSPGLVAFKFTFQLCPIFLTGGIAGLIPGGVLPIITLTEALTLGGALGGGAINAELDGFFANFNPIPGGTLIENDIARYPFANQVVAANAQIQKPIHLSVRMACPAQGELGYVTKLATMTALKSTLEQHNRTGGTYTVMTPSFPYTNGLMTRLGDVTGGETKQVQAEWQWDFEFPLLTLQAAQAAQNSLMSKLSNGTQIGPTDSWSGAGSSLGQPSPLAPVPAAAQAGGSQVITATPLSPVPGVPTSGFNTVQPIPTGYPATTS